MFCGNSREQGTSSGAAGLCSSYLKPWMVHEGELIIENIHPPPSIGNCEVEAGAEFQSSMPFSVLRSSFWVPARLHLTCSLPAIKKKSLLEMKLPPLATNPTSTNWIFRPPLSKQLQFLAGWSDCLLGSFACFFCLSFCCQHISPWFCLCLLQKNVHIITFSVNSPFKFAV